MNTNGKRILNRSRPLYALVGAALAIGACDLAPPPPLPAGTTVSLQPVAEGLTSPVKLVAPPDGSGRLFVVDQIGKIRIIDSSGNLLPEPFLDVSSEMVHVGIDFGNGLIYDERGLLGLAFDPDFASNGTFFVFYSAPPSDQTPEGFNCENHVSRFVVMDGNDNRADPDSETIILRIQKPQFNHNGGDLVFGPDGMLYISTGDGGEANDVGDGHTPNLGNAQDKTKLLGKILRINVDGDTYSVPLDNPFAFVPGARGEIWAYGLRNPFRIAFDRGGSRRLFAGEVGQDLFEEVDIITRGGNFGWNIREGTHCFSPASPGQPPQNCNALGADLSVLVPPILDYPHVAAADGPSGISVIGGALYRGSAAPELKQRYVFGDFSRSFLAADGSLFAATEQANGSWTFNELAIDGRPDGRLGRFVLGFGEDAAGELYLLTSDNVGPIGATGKVFRIATSP